MTIHDGLLVGVAFASLATALLSVWKSIQRSSNHDNYRKFANNGIGSIRPAPPVGTPTNSYHQNMVQPLNSQSVPLRQGLGGADYDPLDTKNLGNILKQNEEWVDEMLQSHPTYFDDTATKQHPKYLWIGCSDARVPPNIVMGEKTDTVFVHRNVANQVINTDNNLMSVIQFAVTAQKVQHIIVCGHYNCGGINASLQNQDHGAPLENWVRNIRDIHRLHYDELSSISDYDTKFRRLVELNVIEQCLNVYKCKVVQERRMETSKDPNFDFTQPRVHALVYDPATGRLKKLNVDFKSYIDRLNGVYELHDPALVPPADE